MSHGTYANSAQITTWDKLQAFMPQEAEEFQAALDEADLTLDEWCDRKERAEVDSDVSTVEADWIIFSKRFEEMTNVHGQCLTISPGYRSEDDYNNYDSEEARNGFFYVGNVYHETGCALRFHDLWVNASWADHG